MTDALTPFNPRLDNALGGQRDNVPRGMTAGRSVAAGAGGDDSGGTIPWMRYLSALKRSWWIVVLATAAGTLVGLKLASMQPIVYVAESRVFLNPSATQPTVPIGTRQFLRTSSWRQLLRSYTVVDPLVRDLKLNVGFEGGHDELKGYFTLDSAFTSGRYQLVVDSGGMTYALTRLNSGAVESGSVGDSIGRQWGFRWAPPPSRLTPGLVVEFKVSPVRAASRALLGRLTDVMQGEDAQFMTIVFRDDNPVRAATILNAWTQRFVEAAGSIKKVTLVQSADAVNEQLAIAERELNRAEAALRRFQENNAALPTREAGGGIATSVLQDRMALDALERDRTKLEALLRQAASGPIPPEAFYTVPGVLNETPRLNNALANLEEAQAARRSKLSYLTEQHRDVDSLTREIRRLELETIPLIVRDLVASYRVREQHIRDRLALQEKQLRDIPAKAFEEAQLNRQVAQFTTLYNTLKLRSEELKLTEAQTFPDLFTLDVAEVPPNPERNQGARLLLMAVVASFGAGIALALLRDRLDRRLRYPEQVSVDLGLTISGTVPKLRFNRKGELGVTATSQVVESFRALRLAVRYQFPPNEPVALCVSSPGAAEGKSLVSAHLAMAFANAGQATLLIDGDVRRGVVYTTFDTPRRPGLVDYLSGKASADDVIRATSTPNLSVITSGSRTKGAPELLVSDRMASLVSAMRERFEVVILDSAPFAAGMDAFALGAAAGAMLIVLRPGYTDRKLAEMKLDVLDRLPVSVLGAVLNGIVNEGSYKYYYTDYAYADARTWTPDEDEDDAAVAGRVEAKSVRRLTARR